MAKLNWQIIRDNIAEAREQLENIEELITREILTENELQTKLEHAFHHLNFAWNVRRVLTKRYKNMSDDDFNVWSKFPAEMEVYKL